MLQAVETEAPEDPIRVRRPVFLDRDGVINEDSPAFVRSVDDWRAIPGSLEAIASLSRAGFDVVIVTNQSGIGRGLYDEAALGRIHDGLIASVRELGGDIRSILHCPHRADEGCACRKPRPGLLVRAERELGLRAKGAPIVGDRVSDLLAGAAMGCLPILVLTGEGERSLRALEDREGIRVQADLARAARLILSGGL